MLAGNYRHGVVVVGACKVYGGVARVHGKLRLKPHATLLADYGARGSRLVVSGDVIVKRGATLVIGCGTQDSPCADQPSRGPHLSSRARIGGSVTASGALGVIIHNAVVRGRIRQSGGGGGLSCNSKPGVFKLLRNPVYSNYEDVTVRGSLTISRLRSCWLGLARNHIGRDLVLKQDDLGDPDAIEVLANHVGRNLRCSKDSRVWDSTEATHAALYPRKAEPNKVHGRRDGQCRLASPTKAGGQTGPGPF